MNTRNGTTRIGKTDVLTRAALETVITDFVAVTREATLRTRREIQAFIPITSLNTTMRAYIMERYTCDQLLVLVRMFASVLGSLDNESFTKLQAASQSLEETCYAQRHKYGPNRN